MKTRTKKRTTPGRRGTATNLYLPRNVVQAAREKFTREGHTLSEAVSAFLRYEVAHKKTLIPFTR